MWEKFLSGGPPSPSLWIFTFFYHFLPFYKPLNWKKKQLKIWSGFGSDPSPPLWEFLPHNPVSFLTTFLIYLPSKKTSLTSALLGTFRRALGPPEPTSCQWLMTLASTNSPQVQQKWQMTTNETLNSSVAHIAPGSSLLAQWISLVNDHPSNP